MRRSGSSSGSLRPATRRLPTSSFPALCRELRQIAEREIHRGGSELTLGTTTLLYAAYPNVPPHSPISMTVSRLAGSDAG